MYLITFFLVMAVTVGVGAFLASLVADFLKACLKNLAKTLCSARNSSEVLSGELIERQVQLTPDIPQIPLRPYEYKRLLRELVD